MTRDSRIASHVSRLTRHGSRITPHVSRITPHFSRITRHASLASTLLPAVLAAAPLFLNSGFLVTRSVGDTPNLLFRVQQLLAALRGGQLLARWMPDGDFGYGYPYFNYYASLSTYLAALFKIYGFSFTLALKLTQFGALAVAALGLYAWARSVNATPAQAWLAAAAYTFAPFHLVNLYVRGDSLGELWAMAFYPLCLWSAQRWINRPTLARAFGLALSVTLLILTHNISALNFLPFLGLYLILKGIRKKEEGSFNSLLPSSCLLLPIAWGLLLSAFFWLPALLELKAVQVTDLTQGFFFYGNNFRGLDLVQPTLFFNSDPTPGLPTPFSMGLAQAIAALAGLIVLGWKAVRSRHWTSLDSFLVLGLGLSTFMITPLSAGLWKYLPLVRYTQFPWRFLSIQALFTAMLTAQLTPAEKKEEASRKQEEGNSTLHPPLSILHFPPSTFFHPSSFFLLPLLLAFFTLGRLRLDFIPLTDADVTAARLNLYEYFTGSIGNTVNNEYLPRGVTPRPFVSEEFLGRPPRLKVLSGHAEGTRQWKLGAAEQWAIQALNGPATVAVPTLYWPGWVAEVDGQRVEIRPAESLGWITIDLQPGAHNVTLRLQDTPVRTAGEIISLIALLLPLAYLVYRQGRHRLEGRHRLKADGYERPSLLRGLPSSVFLLPFFVILLLGSLVLHLLPPPPESALPLSMDFNQLAYLHHDVIRFEGGAQLTRVNYSADHLARGNTLLVHTEWKIAEAAQVTLTLEPPSNLVAPVPIALTSATARLAAARASLSTAQLDFTLTVPANIPPGVYFITLTLTDTSGPRPALTSSGRARGAVYLAPVWIDDPGPTAPTQSLADFGPAIQLVSAAPEINEPDTHTLRLNLLWRALADVPRNYQLSLRLRDTAGAEWAASDSQIAYGYYPTHLWRPGEIIPDFYTLPLPPGAPPGHYTLTLSLYDVQSSNHLGEANLAVNLSNATPAGNRAPQFKLTSEIALAKVEYPPKITQGDAPEISVSWLTLSAPQTLYRARWTLTAPAGVRTSQTLDLAPGSPTNTWPAQAFILGRVRLGTSPSLAPGSYQLLLTLVDEQNQPVGNEVTLGQIEITGRPREFSVPPLQTQVGATFGDKLKLWGYDAERTNAELKLTLVWGALAAPGADYKYFVHLYNSADDTIAAQVDAMPHNFTYPTTLWVADEVVTDTVTLPLTNLSPGTYRLAVGWYDPNSLDRLPAFDAHGQPLDANRVILPLVVEVP